MRPGAVVEAVRWTYHAKSIARQKAHPICCASHNIVDVKTFKTYEEVMNIDEHISCVEMSSKM